MFETHTLKQESTPYHIGGCRSPPRQVESLELVDRLEAGWKASQPNTGQSLLQELCLCNEAIAKGLEASVS